MIILNTHKRCTAVGTAGLLQDHSDALSSTIVFFERLLQMSNVNQTGERRQHLMTMLSNNGGLLVQNVLLGICGKIPWRNVKDGDFNLATLLYAIGAFDLNVLSQLMNYGE